MPPTPCAAAARVPFEPFRLGAAITCARCGARLREGAAPEERAWCPRAPTPAGGDVTLGDDAPATHGGVAAALTRLGRWRLEETLGIGGAGVVYRAWDTVLERRVALKLLSAGAWASPVAIERLNREARAAGRLGLPNVVRVLDLGTADGVPWLAMELVEGPSLAALRADGPLSPALTARIGATLARTLATVHAAGLAHRDVKPSNVMLDPRGEPILVDFGLVVPLSVDPAHTAAQVGTPAYMAPEQLGDPAAIDWRKVDLYALGRVFQELCPDAPPDLAAVFACAAAAQPDARYPDASVLATDLEAWAAGGPLWVLRGGRWHALRALLRRHRRALGWAATAFAVASTLALVGQAGRQAWRRQAREDTEAALEARLDALLPEMARVDAAGGDGEALLAVLVDDPTNVRTAVRSVGWAARARRLTEAGRIEDAREAWARAVLLARRRADHRSALVGLAEALGALKDWAALRRTLAELDTAHPEAPLPVDAPLRRALWAGIGDLRALERISSAEDAAFLASFDTATHLVDAGATWWTKRGPDGAGGDTLYLALVDGGLHALDRQGLRRLGPRAPCGDPAVFYTVLADGEPPRLFGLHPDGFADCGASDGAAHPVRVGGALYSAAGGYERRVYRSTFPGGPRTAPLPDLDALGSYVHEMLAADVDADGVDELVFGMGPPLGYGVRIYDQGDPLTLRARALFGMVVSVGLLKPGWLAAGTTTERPSRYVFGEVDPTGGPPGIHLLQLEGNTLTPRGLLPHPDPSDAGQVSSSGFIWAGDADGDGLTDLVGSHRRDTRTWLALYRGEAGGTFRPWFLEGWLPLLAGQLDDDPAPELLVQQGALNTFREGALYVLGLGDEPMPLLPLGPNPEGGAPEVPADGPPELLFARLGLHATAAAALERAAASETTAAGRVRARTLAAKAWEDAGRYAAAGAAWERVAEEGEGEEAAWAAASSAWGRAGSFEAVAALAPRSPLAALAGPGRALDLTSGRELRFASTRSGGGGQGPARPNLRTGGLDLTVVGGAGLAAVADLVRTADAARIRLRIRMERAEWGSGIVVRFGPDGGAETVSAHTAGGGGLYERRLDTSRCSLVRTSESPDESDVFDIDLAWAASGWWQVLRRGDGAEARCDGSTPIPDGETWRIEVGPDDPRLVGALARGTLESLEVWGLRPDEERPTKALLVPDAPVWVARTDPGRPAAWRDPVAGFAAFRAAWFILVSQHPEDRALAEALDQIPDPAAWAARSADAAWTLAARGRVAWRDGDAVRARRDLRAALPHLGADWEAAHGAHAVLAEIAQAEGDTATRDAEIHAAVAAAPTAEVGWLSLRRWPALARVVDVSNGGTLRSVADNPGHERPGRTGATLPR